MRMRVFMTAGAVGLCCGQTIAASAAEPWAQVPALPAACYSSQDQWWDQNNAAIDAVQETLSAQQAANHEVEQQATQAMNEDPMALAQAMQQAMMDDPANAQKIMERMTQAGQEAQTEVPAQSEKQKQMEAESKAVFAKYEAALGKAEQPAVARWVALQKNMGWEVSEEFALMPDPSWPSSAWQEWGVILKDLDASYVANCTQWWSATGGFQAYMKRYKDYLVQERIPYEKKMFDEIKLNNIKMLGASADGYRSTADFEAAIDYMKMASSLYRQRMAEPNCGPGKYCD